jgi:hypothetical protein
MAPVAWHALIRGFNATEDIEAPALFSVAV